MTALVELKPLELRFFVISAFRRRTPRPGGRAYFYCVISVKYS